MSKPDLPSERGLAGAGLEDLGLSPRALRILSLHKVSVADLTSMTVEDLVDFAGFGQGSAHNVASALRRLGFSLRPSPPKAKSAQRLAGEQRGAVFAERWLAGETLDEIGRSSGVSRERVRQLIWMADPCAAEKKRAARAARTDAYRRDDSSW